jgi:heptosyltransferase-2
MQEILVIRFSSIGDIVLCTPVFRLLKLKFPDAKITFLTKHKFRGTLEGNKHIDRILAWDNLKDREELSHISFDAIVDLHSNLRSLMVKLRFWNVPRTSLNKENLYKLLLKEFRKTPLN